MTRHNGVQQFIRYCFAVYFYKCTIKRKRLGKWALILALKLVEHVGLQ